MNAESIKLERFRWLLTVGSLIALAMGLYHVFLPFLSPLTWAAILVMATWPLYSWINARTNGRAGLAALLMTGIQALVIIAAVVPMLIAITTEAEQFARFIHHTLSDESVTLPSQIIQLPVIGQFIQENFDELRAERRKIAQLVQHYQGEIFAFVTLAAKGVLSAIANIVICLIAMFFFYLHGASLGGQLVRALHHIGGDRFGRLLNATRATVRASLYGIIATAIAQGALAALGYFVSGAPTPLLLGLATVVMSLIPFGTPFVYVPVSFYLMSQGAWVGGIGLLAWGVAVVSTVDNLLRPYFISQATKMPILLVFIGVIGGIVTFGLIGLFVGPALIAVAQVLWKEWVEHAAHDDPSSSISQHVHSTHSS